MDRQYHNHSCIKTGFFFIIFIPVCKDYMICISYSYMTSFFKCLQNLGHYQNSEAKSTNYKRKGTKGCFSKRPSLWQGCDQVTDPFAFELQNSTRWSPSGSRKSPSFFFFFFFFLLIWRFFSCSVLPKPEGVEAFNNDDPDFEEVKTLGQVSTRFLS